MGYDLTIVPDFGHDTEIELKANNDTDAINEVKNLLNSGKYLPSNLKNDTIETFEIVGSVWNNNKDIIAFVGVTFYGRTLQETTVRKP